MRNLKKRKPNLLDQMKTLDLFISRENAEQVKTITYHKDGPKQTKFYPKKTKSIYIGLDEFEKVDYVGQTEWFDPFKRPQQHYKDETKSVVKIKQMILPDWVDLDLAEMYMIKALRPRANKIWAGGLPISAARWIKLERYYTHYYNRTQQ